MPTTIALATTLLTLSTPSAFTDVRLDDQAQLGGNRGVIFQPLDIHGAPAPLHLSARSVIDAASPFDHAAVGQLGTVYIDSDGAGVQDAFANGSKGVSGGGGHQDEELVFTFTGSASADSISIGLASFKPGDGLGKDDDAVLFVTLAGGNVLTFDENDYAAAYTDHGSGLGTIALGQITALQGTIVDHVTVRETRDHIWINSVAFASVPAPGALAFFALAGVRRRRRA